MKKNNDDIRVVIFDRSYRFVDVSFHSGRCYFLETFILLSLQRKSYDENFMYTQKLSISRLFSTSLEQNAKQKQMKKKWTDFMIY